jgi:hypothetical protein
MHVSTPCPRCAFGSGGTTHSAPAGRGLMRCRQCGSTWREVGNPDTQPASSGSAPLRPVPVSASLHQAHGSAAAMLGQGSLPPRPASPRRASPRIAIAVAAVAGFGVSFFTAATARNAETAIQPLEFSALSARSYSRDGRIAVRVEGRLANRGPRPIAVGGVMVTLSGGAGERVYGWVYFPSVSHLGPGESIRFSTADGSVPRGAGKIELRHGDAVAALRL